MTTHHQRTQIARRRLVNILYRHTIAIARTLEQKIADAGPPAQRIDPHILTPARDQLIEEGRIVRLSSRQTTWYHLNTASPEKITQRLHEQEPNHRAVIHHNFTKRLGQTAEIAVYRALQSQNILETLGRFPDLHDHDDSQLYRKQEPPAGIAGNHTPTGPKVDFLAHHPDAGWAAIEIKNIREWLYPDRKEIKDLLQKSLDLNAIPVLIARRIPYVTRRVLASCGVILWQTYHQLYPESDAQLANQARNKQLLAYHDIRLGNQPSPHLYNFITKILPEELSPARERFDQRRDLLQAFVFQGMPYSEFAAQARPRKPRTTEDNDQPEEHEPHDH